MKTERTTCWWCGGELIWSNDFAKCDIYDDPDADGIVTYLNCKDCGALVTYETPDEE